jgi:hypothetical protein
MSRTKRYHYYFKRIDVDSQAQRDVENDSSWAGLKYMRADGLYDMGKSKNIYTEGYADIDRLRVSLPSNGVYANEATKITMHFLIVGKASSRTSTLRSLETYLREGIHTYWDTARNLEFDFIVQDEIKQSDEKWYGDIPYVEIAVPMQNLNGRVREHTVEES